MVAINDLFHSEISNVLFKLGSLESLVVSGFNRIDEKMESIKGEMHSSKMDLTLLEQRVKDIETWKTIAITRVTAIASAFALGWVIFGDSIKNVIGQVF